MNLFEQSDLEGSPQINSEDQFVLSQFQASAKNSKISSKIFQCNTFVNDINQFDFQEEKNKIQEKISKDKNQLPKIHKEEQTSVNQNQKEDQNKNFDEQIKQQIKFKTEKKAEDLNKKIQQQLSKIQNLQPEKNFLKKIQIKKFSFKKPSLKKFEHQNLLLQQAPKITIKKLPDFQQDKPQKKIMVQKKIQLPLEQITEENTTSKISKKSTKKQEINTIENTLQKCEDLHKICLQSFCKLNQTQNFIAQKINKLQKRLTNINQIEPTQTFFIVNKNIKFKNFKSTKNFQQQMQNTTLIFAIAAVMTGLTVYFTLHNKPSSSNTLKQFSDFKQKFGKEHSTQAELEYRYQVFQSNLEMINDINSSNRTFKAAVNQFSDLTFEEFKNKYLSKQAIPLEFDDLLESSSDVTGNVDWRKDGHVSEVKNQQQCGSCWAFSTTGSLESAISIFQGKKVDLSEQQLVDCDEVDQGCNGGLMDYAYRYIEKNGLTTEALYPYKGYEQDCAFDTGMENYRPKQHKAISPANVNGLMAALMKQPVSVAIEVQHDFMHYSSGVYQNTHCGTRLNHGVLAVGFNNESSNETPYFIVKNSWSEQWGEQGYIRMAVGKRSYGTCGIANASDVYPIF